jgi:hypothetical protein
MIRVYRDDNSFYEESEYLAVVDNQQCYLVDIVSIDLPEWNNAVIRFLCEVTLTPDPGLLNHTTSAWAGWHFLIEPENIREVQNYEIVEEHIVADVIMKGSIQRDLSLRTSNLVEIVLSWMKPTVQAGYRFTRHFPYGLGRRFTDEQLQEAIQHLQQGEKVEFRYQEYGEE